MSKDVGPSVGDLVTAPLRVAQGLPVVGSLIGGVRRRIGASVDDVVAQLVSAIVTTLAEEVDLTKLVVDNVDLAAIVATVDLNAVVAQVDLDSAVARVDLTAAVHRVDLIGVAEEIIDGVDLPSIIRDASTSVTAEVMTDVRSGGERADDAVADFVGRMLGRRSAERDDD